MLEQGSSRSDTDHEKREWNRADDEEQTSTEDMEDPKPAEKPRDETETDGEGVIAGGKTDEESAPPPASTPAPGPGDPPDGGLNAWVQVAGAFLLFFNTWGILNTWGVYQTYYESGALFKASSSDIAWIGSIQAVALLLAGMIAGPTYDHGYFKHLITGGSFLIVFGHMMLSLSHTLWEAILAQGFCIGLGAGCMFIPCLAVLPTYFRRHLGLAIGLAASGSSLGGVIYPIMFYKLINEIGYAWAVRILGFTALATLTVPLTTMRMRFKPPKARAVFDPTALSDYHYLFFVFGMFFGFVGLYVGLFYVSYFGQATGFTDASLSFYLIPILNAASCFGRTVPNWISDRTGPMNMLIPGAAICGALLLCFLAVTSAGGVVVLTLLFGFFSGVFIALPPVIIVSLTKDKSKLGTRIGMAFAAWSGAGLAGGPGTGGILGTDMRDLNWTGAWIYGGVCMLFATACFLFLRIWRAGAGLTTKI